MKYSLTRRRKVGGEGEGRKERKSEHDIRPQTVSFNPIESPSICDIVYSQNFIKDN